ncbi:MAG: hypothetical protein RIR97_659 [Pseudomonadota bacterium]
MTRQTQDSAETTGGPWQIILRFRRFWPLALMALAVGIFYVSGLHDYLTLETLSRHHREMKDLVVQYPVLAPVLYGLAYALAAALSLPGVSVLTLFAGFLFGWLLGGTIVVFAATLGGTLLFLATRTALGGILRQKAGPAVQRFSEGFAANAFAYMLVLRLAPIFPFFIVNIAPGIVGIPVSIFVSATIIGIVPGTFAYAWLGHGLEAALATAEAQNRAVALSDFMSRDITYAFAAIALLTGAAFLYRHWQTAKTRQKESLT